MPGSAGFADAADAALVLPGAAAAGVVCGVGGVSGWLGPGVADWARVSSHQGVAASMAACSRGWPWGVMGARAVSAEAPAAVGWLTMATVSHTYYRRKGKE